MNEETPNATISLSPMVTNSIFWVGMSQAQKREYSITNLMSGILSGKHEGLEFEVADIVKKKRKRNNSIRNGAASFPIPYDVLYDTEQDITSIGATHNPNSFIDMLYDHSVIISAGATVLPGLVGDRGIPSKIVSGWGDENTNVIFTDEDLKPKVLSTKALGYMLGYTESMLQPSMEPFIYDDLRRHTALLIDSIAIAGTETQNQPNGILNTDGINEVRWTARNGITQETIAEFPKILDKNNALRSNRVFLITSAFYHSVMTTNKDKRSEFLMNNNRMLEGYPVFLNAGGLGNNILFGDFSQLILGFGAIVELSLRMAGEPVINVWTDIDVCVRDTASFCKGIPT